MKTQYFEEINDGNMDINFLLKLDKAREISGIPFVINSAFRTHLENRRVGGSKDSSHLKGLAVDISCTDSIKRHKIINSLIHVGFNRIGIATTFIHVDDDKDKVQNVIWTY